MPYGSMRKATGAARPPDGQLQENRLAPLCCEAHEEEFRTELLQMLRECVEMQEEQDAAVADESGDAPAQVH
jgi:hypothetical protein